MFGSLESKMVRWAKHNRWDKIVKKLDKADAAARLAVAKACGDSKDEGAGHMLTHFLADPDPAVLLETVKSMGKIGGEAAKTHLQKLGATLPADATELRQALSASISQINGRL